MHICPGCTREFDDATIYCPDDGTRLVSRTRLATAHESDSIAPDHTRRGEVIAERYVLDEMLGEGGMGVVYAATDTRLDKPVALKLLRADLAHRPDVVARFTQEARSAARIKHENVLDVTDYGEHAGGGFFIAMEKLEGHDLADVLATERTLPAARAIDITLQVCRALATAHERGVVHRDLKPENVFLVRSADGRETVKIVDFGIAQMKDLSGDAGGDGDSGRKITQAGQIFGTPEYMSPEQAQGLATDPRVDVYATGVMLFEMLAGRVPFTGGNFMGVLQRHIAERVPTIHSVNPAADAPPPLERVVMRALAKSPDDRYATMTALADDLVRVRDGVPPSSTVRPPANTDVAATTKRVAWWWPVGAGALVAMAVVAYASTRRTTVAPVEDTPVPHDRPIVTVPAVTAEDAAVVVAARDAGASPDAVQVARVEIADASAVVAPVRRHTGSSGAAHNAHCRPGQTQWLDQSEMIYRPCNE